MPFGVTQALAQATGPGFSSGRPGQACPSRCSAQVEKGLAAGVVTLISRHGETHVSAAGVQDLAGQSPMRRDTIFRIASIGKPLTAAAAMILVDEGKLALDDPVDTFLPELADRRVLRTLDSPLDDTVPAKRAITLRDLLTLKAGIGAVMVFPPKYPIQMAMQEAGVSPSGRSLPRAARRVHEAARQPAARASARRGLALPHRHGHRRRADRAGIRDRASATS